MEINIQTPGETVERTQVDDQSNFASEPEIDKTVVLYSKIATCSEAHPVYEINQLDIPEAFIALYSRGDRISESREFVHGRYETCEDLSRQVGEFCKTLAFKDDLAEPEVLRRCHVGLLQTPGVVSPREASWVVSRVAELLEWNQPLFLDEAPVASP